MDAKELADLPDGTELLVRMTKLVKQGNFIKVGGRSSSIWVLPELVECVAPPKPEPIKVGDTVVSKMGGCVFHQVLGIHEKFVWLKPIRETGLQFDEDVSTHYLKDFKRADQ